MHTYRVRALACAPVLPVAALFVSATLLLPSPAHAGRAQAFSSIGLFSNADLVSGSTTGNGFRNGAVVETANVTGDPSSATIQVFDALESARVRLDSQGVLRGLGDSAGLPFSGYREVEANRSSGTLKLGGSSTFASYEVPPSGFQRQGSVAGYSGAEIIENYSILFPATRVDPVVVTLRLNVTGTMTGNGGGNGFVNGLQAYMILSNTDTDPGFAPGTAPVFRTETSVSGTEITISGSPLNIQCLPGQDFCESFFGVYAGVDMQRRSLSTGVIDIGISGAPYAADFTGQLTLEVSPGVTVLQMNARGDAETLHSWVNPVPIPEPGTWMLMLGGLAALGATVRRRAARN